MIYLHYPNFLGEFILFNTMIRYFVSFHSIDFVLFNHLMHYVLLPVQVLLAIFEVFVLVLIFYETYGQRPLSQRPQLENLYKLSVKCVLFVKLLQN